MVVSLLKLWGAMILHSSTVPSECPHAVTSAAAKRTPLASLQVKRSPPLQHYKSSRRSISSLSVSFSLLMDIACQSGQVKVDVCCCCCPWVVISD